MGATLRMETKRVRFDQLERDDQSTTASIYCEWINGERSRGRKGEADDLEDDQEVVIGWIPNSLRTWIESSFCTPIQSQQFSKKIMLSKEEEEHQQGQCERGFKELIDEEEMEAEDARVSTAEILRWLILLQFVENLPRRCRGAVLQYLRRIGAVTQIFAICLYWTDLQVLNASSARIVAGTERWRTFKIEQLSESKHNAGLTSSSIEIVSDLCTHAMYVTVQSLPSLVRKWYEEDCPRSESNSFLRFVRERVGPSYLQKELQAIKEAEHKEEMGEMTVGGSCVSREVVATYVQDECELRVVICIPPAFPLRNVEVDCRGSYGVKESRRRRWQMQITRMLHDTEGEENGSSILDALLLWKENVDKEFEGLEPCPICYAVLCPKTHALPKLECNTCHNRYHGGCLYKWFSSSGNNKCVICQQPWSGTKL